LKQWTCRPRLAAYAADIGERCVLRIRGKLSRETILVKHTHMVIIENLQKISDTVWELPATYKQGMRVPARIIATEKLVREMDEAVYQQISNVATLPGITRYAPIHA